MQQYPKWLFSVNGKRLVQNYEQHQALGPGWYESRRDLPAPAPKPVKSETPPAATAAPVVPAAVAEMAKQAEAILKKFYNAPAKIIVDQVMTMESVADLLEVRDTEENRPGGARKTVLKALSDRLASLSAPSDETPEEEPELAGTQA